MTYDDPQKRRQKRSGQTLVEFALTLPLLLLLVFGIIEFGRAFQAWVTLENSAREAARYTTTGQYDTEKYNLLSLLPCTQEDFAQGPGQRTQFPLNPDATIHINTSTGGMTAQTLFATYYDGQNCDPGNAEHLERRRDIVRLASIYDTARRASAGLALEPSVQDGTVNALFNQLSHQWQLPRPRSNEPGYFDVVVCSTRSKLDNFSSSFSELSNARFAMVFDETDLPTGFNTPFSFPFCMLNEVPPLGEGETQTSNNRLSNYTLPWIDAGGPGDRITVVVTFNHPLITPLFDFSYITMQAQRSGVNETFRTSRALNAVQGSTGQTALGDPPPGQLPPPGETPETPPVDPNDPGGEDDPDNQDNPPAPIPEFSCDGLNISNIVFNSNAVEFVITNDNMVTTTLQSVRLQWVKPSYAPDMELSRSSLNGSPHWIGLRASPLFLIGDPAIPPGSDLTGNDITRWRNAFQNGGLNIPGKQNATDAPVVSTYRAEYINVATLGQEPGNPNGLTSASFNGTTITVLNPDGSPCIRAVTGTETPTNPEDPTDPEEPPIEEPEEPDNCATAIVEVRFDGFETFGVVRLRVQNFRNRPSPLLGFNLFWFDSDPEPPYSQYNYPSTVSAITGNPNALYLARVLAGPVGGNVASAVPVWRETPPATRLSPTINHPGARNEGEWLRNYSFAPESVSYIYLDFDGTSGRLDTAYGMAQWMFNGQFWIDCILPDGTSGAGGPTELNGNVPFGDPPPPPPPEPIPDIRVVRGSTIIGIGATHNLDLTARLGVSSPTRDLTIQSRGGEPLVINGPITITPNSGITIVSPDHRQNGATVNPGSNLRLRLQCNGTEPPTGAGLRTAQVTINNNVAGKNPYTFTVTCMVENPVPDIVIRGRRNDGNINTIGRGNSNPHHFPAVTTGSPNTQTITIRNPGSDTLVITGPPTITSGSGVSIISNPPTTIEPGNNNERSFQIRCNAAVAGSYTVRISVPTNVSGKNPYTFDSVCNVSDPAPPPVNEPPPPTEEPPPPPPDDDFGIGGGPGEGGTSP